MKSARFSGRSAAVFLQKARLPAYRAKAKDGKLYYPGRKRSIALQTSGQLRNRRHDPVRESGAGTSIDIFDAAVFACVRCLRALKVRKERMPRMKKKRKTRHRSTVRTPNRCLTGRRARTSGEMDTGLYRARRMCADVTRRYMTLHPAKHRKRRRECRTSCQRN